MENNEEGIKRFGRYQILSELGRGGMGQVFQAHDLQLHRIVAMKVLLTGDFSKEADIQRFLREAKATAKLQHPNIVAVHDIGEEQGRPFFTMDFIDGVSLKAAIKRSPSIHQTVEWMAKIGRAIHYAHSQGIIHRDLKPQNIMIDDHHEPKVMDFGLAKVSGQSKQISKTGMVMGTLQYMSPEQAEGKNRQVDERSDVYGLGAILYEMLTGQPPFTSSSSSSVQLLYQVAEKDPIAPRTLKPRIPKDLESICLKALEKKKEHRYQTAEDFVQDLILFSQGEPVKARPMSLSRRLWRRIRRNRYHLAFASVCLAFVCVSFFYRGVQLRQPVEPHEKTVKVGEPPSPPAASEKPKVSSIPEQWPSSLWKLCWHGEEGWLDFTTPAWEKLFLVEQIQYTKAYQSWYAEKLGVPLEQSFSLLGTSFEMILIPPGKFWMGSPPGEPGREQLELRHRVVLSKSFWMQKTELTQKQWRMVTGEKPWSGKPAVGKWAIEENDSHPATYIASPEMEGKLLVKLDKLEYREKSYAWKLPSEAEWEYACRAGTQGRFYWGDSVSEMGQYANVCDQTSRDSKRFPEKTNYVQETRDSFALISPVGQLKPNAFGLYDMIGNVWERCADGFENYPAREVRDPLGKNDHVRISRGGSWDICLLERMRCAARGRSNVTLSCSDLGTRLVLREVNDP